jgi:SprT-like domain-contaning protein Spartan
MNQVILIASDQDDDDDDLYVVGEFKRQRMSNEMNDQVLAAIIAQEEREAQLVESEHLALALLQQQEEEERRQSDSSQSFVLSDELSDPTPDARALFLHLNKAYFEQKLSAVEVKWSTRMTLCAGQCHWHGKHSGYCVIKLSEPLLRLRPRADMIDTLLHEMIHAYLFVTEGNTDRDGHGPAFLAHADRINAAQGSSITVYHNFCDEVDHYRVHWWRCDRCHKIVKRAINRAPSPNDRWWPAHQRQCGGSYVKFLEPASYGAKRSRKRSRSQVATSKDASSSSSSSSDSSLAIDNFFGKQ